MTRLTDNAQLMEYQRAFKEEGDGLLTLVFPDEISLKVMKQSDVGARLARAIQDIFAAKVRVEMTVEGTREERLRRMREERRDTALTVTAQEMAERYGTGISIAGAEEPAAKKPAGEKKPAKPRTEQAGKPKDKGAAEEGPAPTVGKPILGTVNMYGWRDKAYYASDPWRGTWKGEGGGVLVNQAPHQLDLLLWYMGEIDELYGMWDTLNHPGLEVEDTAIAVIRFKNGGLGNIVVSNSQNPALYGKVHVHGDNGASIGVQTDGGAMFIAGVSSITEAPYNDLWTVPGEAELKDRWKAEDEAYFQTIDATTHFHYVQLNDFIEALRTGRKPLISLEDARRTVELFTAIYRSQRDHKPVRFPLVPENGSDFDGRIR